MLFMFLTFCAVSEFDTRKHTCTCSTPHLKKEPFIDDHDDDDDDDRVDDFVTTLMASLRAYLMVFFMRLQVAEVGKREHRFGVP